MEYSDWVQSLKESGKVEELRESAPGEYELFVSPLKAHALLEELKGHADFPFAHLADLSGYDEHPKQPRFHVFYELISMESSKRLRVVAPLAEKNEIDTVVDLWSGASWLERETYDMYGIHFKGHPDLRRILLPPSFKGHPLQKDFVVDYRQEFEAPSGDEEIFDPFGNNVVKEGVKK